VTYEYGFVPTAKDEKRCEFFALNLSPLLQSKIQDLAHKNKRKRIRDEL
jgi:hypothetical protein